MTPLPQSRPLHDDEEKEDLVGRGSSSSLPLEGLTGSSQSDTASNSRRPILCRPHSPEASPPTAKRKGVRFAEEPGTALGPVPSMNVPSETMQQLHHNTQVAQEGDRYLSIIA